jgi:membrane-associated PAP2 superfamily phosphatase
VPHRHWPIRLLALPALAMAASILLLHESPADRAFLSWLWDAKSRLFPAKQHWFFRIVVHEGMKIAVIALGVVALGLLVGGWRWRALRAWRRPLVLVVVCVALVPALVGWLKSVSPRHCPWNLELYGGSEPWASLWDPLPAGSSPGKCFPSGHASGGFSLLSCWFALRPSHPALARAVLGIALAYGGAMGLARCAMGAHFPSHVVGSLLVAWTVCVLAARVVLPEALGVHPARACNRA